MKDSQIENTILENETLTENKIVKTDAIRERAFSFAVRIVKLCKFLEKNSDVSKSLINQLLCAGTSVGANLEEAVAGRILFIKTRFP